MKNDPSEPELSWRKYSLIAELYKFYLSLIVKANIFYYAVTGAIVSFCVTRSEISYAKYSLVLPFIMSLCFIVIFCQAIKPAQLYRNESHTLSRELKFKTSLNFDALVHVLKAFIVLHITCVIGIVILLCCIVWPRRGGTGCLSVL